MTDLVGKFRALKNVALAFIQQPQPSLTTLAELPAILRGLNFSQNSKWPSLFRRSSLPNQNVLRIYFDSHKQGRGIWKWNHYFDIYDRYFKKFVGREVHILEIGVYSGGSLDMWRHYFGKKCHVYGVDLEKACKVYENNYTKIFIGDQKNRKFWQLFKSKVPRIDIVVDDGGHETNQQIATLEELIPHLSPGGVYLCEDINCTNNAFTSYLHGLVRNLNEENGKPLKGVQPTPFQSWVKSIHFYPCVTVIEKADRPIKRFISMKHGTEWQPFYDPTSSLRSLRRQNIPSRG